MVRGKERNFRLTANRSFVDSDKLEMFWTVNAAAGHLSVETLTPTTSELQIPDNGRREAEYKPALCHLSARELRVSLTTVRTVALKIRRTCWGDC